MAENNRPFRKKIEGCLCMEEPAQRRAVWHQLFTESGSVNLEEELYQFVTDLMETAQKKQALAEERQTLLNTWQQEKAQAVERMDCFRQQMQEAQEKQEKTEKRMRGYEAQFAALQDTAREALASMKAAADEKDLAWAQFQERENQLDQLRKELRVKQDQIDQMEKMLPVRIYRKIRHG